MLEEGKPHLLVGDFNYCYLDGASNTASKFFEMSNFKQLIKEPTHLGGNLLDQAYLRDISGKLQYSVILHSKYYTDHKGLAIIIKRGNYKSYSTPVLKDSNFSKEMI